MVVKYCLVELTFGRGEVGEFRKFKHYFILNCDKYEAQYWGTAPLYHLQWHDQLLFYLFISLSRTAGPAFSNTRLVKGNVWIWCWEGCNIVTFLPILMPKVYTSQRTWGRTPLPVTGRNLNVPREAQQLKVRKLPWMGKASLLFSHRKRSKWPQSRLAFHLKYNHKINRKFVW